MTPKPDRFVLGDIVRDGDSNLGAVVFVSVSGRHVLAQQGADKYQLYKATELTLHLSSFAKAAQQMALAIRRI